jgi:hypothetical protein
MAKSDRERQDKKDGSCPVTVVPSARPEVHAYCNCRERHPGDSNTGCSLSLHFSEAIAERTKAASFAKSRGSYP